MRILPTDQEASRIRDQVRAFCDRVLPATTAGLERQGTMSDGDSPAFQRLLGEAGWIGRHWPREYGGQGASHLETGIADEALGYSGAPLSGYLLSVKVFGNSLLLFGTEEQKRSYLPRIARGEIIMCQGFSEPEAGSDFGSLRTTARRVGNEYIVSGQKIWTSSAEVADYMYLAARTDPDAPKHRGISLFILDMRSPGVTVRTFPTLGGGLLNEVFLDEVRVPAENLIGEPNRGFHQAMRSLDLERTCLDRVGAAWRALDDLNEYVHREGTRPDGGRLADVPAVRERLAELYSRLRVARLFGYLVVRRLDQGLGASAEFSYGKLYIGLLTQAIADAMTELVGFPAQFEHGSSLAPMRGRPAAIFRASPALTLAGGSSEVQRTVIAIRGLGLPK